MNCEDARLLLHAHLDGELDAARDLEVTRHLEGCAECTREFERARAMRSRLRSGEFHYAAPAGLETRVRNAMARERRSARTAPPRRVPRWSMIAAPLALAALLLVMFVPAIIRPSASDLVPQEVAASHVRSLMASHLIDVASTDQHTVKPWFAGKLDFSPVVKDFASAGFPLIGGRLDYIDNRTAAAVVYQHGKHVINLFMWPGDPGEPVESFKTLSRNGYNLESFSKDGMQCWLVSDLQASEIDRLAHMIAGESGSSAEPDGSPAPK